MGEEEWMKGGGVGGVTRWASMGKGRVAWGGVDQPAACTYGLRRAIYVGWSTKANHMGRNATKQKKKSATYVG